jgi:phage gp37-like protein
MGYTGYSIEEIEDAIVTKLSEDTTLKTYIKTFERMPWENLDDLEKLLRQYPAIVVSYAGGEDDTGSFSVLDHAGRFAVMCAHKNFRSSSAAARGLITGEKGVYDMLNDVLSALNFTNLGLDIISCRSLRIRRVAATNNLTIFSREFEIKWRYTYTT